MRFLLSAGAALLVAGCASTGWRVQHNVTRASLRGVSAPKSGVVWVSGSKGTVLRTVDGGAHWKSVAPPGSADADFRDVDAVDENTAYLMRIEQPAAVYRTTDGGATWTAVYTHPDPAAFLDCMAFSDAAHGLVLGDPIGGRFVVVLTRDGGSSWRSPDQLPSAAEGEAAFAASGTCAAADPTERLWFVTGGSVARIFRSDDAGTTWSAFPTPIPAGVDSAGNFSVAFLDRDHGVVTGGDYKRPGAAGVTAAVTSDGGATWRAADMPPRGFRSGTAPLPRNRQYVAVGTSGSDVSADAGRTWAPLSEEGFNAVAVSPEGDVWAVAADGRIAHYIAPQ